MVNQVIRFVQQENKTHTVVIWGKSYCPATIKTKRLFAQDFPNVQVKIHDLNLMGDGSVVERDLIRLTKQKASPNVFVNNQHVGGYNDVLAAAESGELTRLLFPKNEEDDDDDEPLEEKKEEDAVSHASKLLSSMSVSQTSATATQKKPHALPMTTLPKTAAPKAPPQTQPQAPPPPPKAHHRKASQPPVEEKKQEDNVASSSHALLRTMIEHENNVHSVVVWGKTTCPDTQQAKKLLGNLRQSISRKSTTMTVAFHMMDEMPKASMIEEELGHLTGQHTTPNVFVDGLHLGGGKELESAVRSGALKGLVVT